MGNGYTCKGNSLDSFLTGSFSEEKKKCATTRSKFFLLLGARNLQSFEYQGSNYLSANVNSVDSIILQMKSCPLTELNEIIRVTWNIA